MTSMSEVVIRVFRVSGYVTGPCPKCSKEERGLVMFEDYALGWECLSCGEIGRADRVEWIEGKDPALADLDDDEEWLEDAAGRADAAAVTPLAFSVEAEELTLTTTRPGRAESGVATSFTRSFDPSDRERHLLVRRLRDGQLVQNLEGTWPPRFPGSAEQEGGFQHPGLPMGRLDSEDVLDPREGLVKALGYLRVVLELFFVF